jgi:hypothetical protein
MPFADPAATIDAPWGVPTTSLAAGARAPVGGFDEELRRLLPSRLILVHVLALTFFVLIAAVSFYGTGAEGDPTGQPGWWLRLAVPLAECLIGAIVLWRSPELSQRSLRLWELAHFGILAAFFGLSRFERLAYVDVGNRNPLTQPYFALLTLQLPAEAPDPLDKFKFEFAVGAFLRPYYHRNEHRQAFEPFGLLTAYL